MEPQEPPTSTNDLLNFLGSVTPSEGFIQASFDGAYFTKDENAWLDGVCSLITTDTKPPRRDWLYYLLFQACLRKRPFNLFHRQNLSLRLSRKKGAKFGNQTTWDRSFSSHMVELLEELTAYKLNYPSLATVLPSDDIFAAAPKVDLVYLDPPYIAPGRYTESYLERYHFLEGLTDPASWSDRFSIKDSKLSFRSAEEARLWADRNTFPDMLLGAISAYSESIVVLSYPANSFPSEVLIESFFKSIFSSVSVYKRMRSVAMSANPITEIVFVGRP